MCRSKYVFYALILGALLHLIEVVVVVIVVVEVIIVAVVVFIVLYIAMHNDTLLVDGACLSIRLLMFIPTPIRKK